MRKTKILLFLTIVLAAICIFGFSNGVSAYKISDDGKYTLVLNVDEGEIDGLPSKMIKFDFDEGEDKVKLSDLTKGIVPFNGKNEFSFWAKDWNGTEKIKEELTASDFTSSGTSGEISYTNGLDAWAIFSGKALQGTGTYYLTLDPFAGKINGKDNIRLTSKSSEFKTVDLTKYTPVRKGYTFVGWDYNGKLVKSINSSYFKKCDAIQVTAVYTKDSFEGGQYVLVLNANGGKIDGKSSNKYDYIGGATSGTYMPIFHYVPTREGYTFKGWNTKKDGSGSTCTYMYWRDWRDDEDKSGFERDTLVDGLYKNLTLYATWEKNSETTEETVKKIESTGKTKANIEFAKGINKDYTLNIKEVEVKDNLSKQNIKFIADINVMDGNNIVKINNTKMKIRIAMPESLKGYNKYEVVYLVNGEIRETLPATVENVYLVFETTHLSEYGIVAKKVSGKNDVNNPNTGDNIMVNILLFTIATATISTVFVFNKRNK